MNDINDLGGKSVSNVMRPLHRSSVWIKLISFAFLLFALMNIIHVVGFGYGLYMLSGEVPVSGPATIGGLSVYFLLNCIYIFITIWLSILLRRAASEANEAFRTGNEKDATIATSSLGTVFKIFGVFVLIGLLLMLFVIVMVFLAYTGIIAMPAWLTGG